MGRLLVLASRSPQRVRLLKELGVPFRTRPSRVSEWSAEKDPRKLVEALALRKARAVARLHPRSRVLGADTVVVCRGEILVKPRGRKDSERILRLLNGSWQEVYTGVALVWEGGKRRAVGSAKTRVLARKLPEARLQAFVGKHMDKAGSYAIQDEDDPFIERIVGDLDNVIGLPLRVVRRLLAGQ